MQTRQRSFWWPALFALSIITILKVLQLYDGIPLLGQLLANQDPPGIIALLVLGLTLFCLLRLGFWRISAWGQLSLVRQAQGVLVAALAQPLQHPNVISEIKSTLGPYYATSIIRRYR